MTNTINDLKNTLTLYFSRYFKDVRVELSHEEDPPKSGRVRINMYVSFVDEDGKEFVLARIAELLNSKLTNILTINNNQDA